MTMHELANLRSSCRAYRKDKPVSRELLTELLETAILSPSASNRQSWRFHVCTGEAAADIAACCMVVPGNNTWAPDCPAFIVISSTTRQSRINGGEPHEFPIADAGIAAAFLCLAAAEKGLATCIIGSADEAGVKARLAIDPERRVHLIIAVGYAAAPAPTDKPRLPFAELVTFTD